jgi:hypothetical protein
MNAPFTAYAGRAARVAVVDGEPAPQLPPGWGAVRRPVVMRDLGALIDEMLA